MRSKLGTWSTGGKSADAGGAPVAEKKIGKLPRQFKSGAKPMKTKDNKGPKPFGVESKLKRRKKGI